MSSSIRASPYEPGLYFVSPEPGTTRQSIGTTEWKVGERYTLEKVLGYGSFSCVCLAHDNYTGEKIALKRIGDVLHSVEQAKRVLREIAILRRTSHPNLIAFRDCFIRPSVTGSCRLVNGRLVSSSIDLYLATEYAQAGDLFHIRGQLSEDEVRSLMWQLIQAVRYLHRMHVWHRDVKSQNAFITWVNGVRVVKLGDFGSARSALFHDLALEKNTNARVAVGGQRNGNSIDDNNTQQQQTNKTKKNVGRQENDEDEDEDREHDQPCGATPDTTKKRMNKHAKHRLAGLATDRSYQEMNEAMVPDDLYAIPVNEMNTTTTGATSTRTSTTETEQIRNNNGFLFPTNGNANQPSPSSPQPPPQPPQPPPPFSTQTPTTNKGFKAPLTRVVATPCYRAPEVVMSRGGYTSALDTWGVGCIFGELLQRVAYVGSAATPNLAVAPLFAIAGRPKPPAEGGAGEDVFDGHPENAMTRRELQALFDVLGTPSWRDAAAVEMEEWRNYLERLPGKAPTLFRQFKSSGEVAVHLLSRLLDFDPQGRATCEEALAHEFFAGLRDVLYRNSAAAAGAANAAGHGHGHHAMSSYFSWMYRGSMGSLESGLEAMEEGEGEEEEGDDDDDDVMMGTATTDMKRLSFDHQSNDGITTNSNNTVTLAVDAAAEEATRGADIVPASGLTRQGSRPLPSFWEESNPGKALAMLEAVLEEVSGTGGSDGNGTAPPPPRPNDASYYTNSTVLDPHSHGYQKLRDLLEAECAAAAAEAELRRCALAAAAAQEEDDLETPRPVIPPQAATDETVKYCRC